MNQAQQSRSKTQRFIIHLKFDKGQKAFPNLFIGKSQNAYEKSQGNDIHQIHAVTLKQVDFKMPTYRDGQQEKLSGKTDIEPDEIMPFLMV
ncbi:hypothetical protein SDC9_109370 [bioreactor metagenome]|uniref:Uncharacterized protein n=1 Tax=bioreactor metagenome TaxID=1076179 RepID=A0A645BAR6_9ZZZZ